MKLAVYGTLREGEMNFKRFNLKYLKTVVLSGYEMFNVGSYPGIKKGKGNITVDVLECTPKTLEAITWMERNANYHPEKIKIDGETCVIYIYDGHVTEKIKTGDWKKA